MAIQIKDGDYILTEGSGWFTVGGFSIRLNKTDEGVAVDIYKLGAETDGAIGSTWVLDADLEELDGALESRRAADTDMDTDTIPMVPLERYAALGRAVVESLKEEGAASDGIEELAIESGLYNPDGSNVED